MKYTLTFRESDYDILTNRLFIDRTVERAAYALCRVSTTESETRLLIRKIIFVEDEDIEEATETGIKIKSRSFIKAMQEADRSKQVFLFIHSHPEGYVDHSPKDNLEEIQLFKTAYVRIKTPGVHGSLVLSDPEKPVCRIWLEDGSIQPVSLIRVIGSRFRFFTDLSDVDPLPIFFDRQIKAFGEDIQKVLQILNIGIVGVGGTGSSVTEQLTRLGVGHLTIFDDDTFQSSNVNRVYGSSSSDEERQKVAIAADNVEHVGVNTKLTAVNKLITFQSAVQALKGCDIIFGCTDDEWGRAILNKLSVYYHIPVFDMGVKINSENGEIQHVEGRVTTLLGGYACLICRNRLSSKRIQSESLSVLDPERFASLKEQRYVDELEGTAPAVIPFTTNIASLAVSEFLHRLTGYMGAERQSNEIIMQFHETKIRRNTILSKEGCYCGDTTRMLRGDASPLLDLTWRKE